MQCPACGREIEEGLLFCSFCGAAVVSGKGADADKQPDHPVFTQKQRSKKTILRVAAAAAAVVLLFLTGAVTLSALRQSGPEESLVILPGKAGSRSGADSRSDGGENGEDATEPTASPETAETEADEAERFLRSLSPDSWQLQLVGKNAKLKESYEPEGLISLKNNQKVAPNCYYDLKDMMSACRLDGLDPKICRSYVSAPDQSVLFENCVQALMDQGFEEKTARILAENSEEPPCCSEHQTGLAIDMLSESNQERDHSQDNSAVLKWMLEYGWTYGFVQRYPPDKAEITGVSYEPWHFRYVGTEIAEYMHTYNLCLEELVALAEAFAAENE